MLKVAGLWLNKSAKGETYFTGTLGNVRVVILKNNFKEKEAEPDYNMYFDERKKKETPESGVAESNDNPFDDVQQ